MTEGDAETLGEVEDVRHSEAEPLPLREPLGDLLPDGEALDVRHRLLVGDTVEDVLEVRHSEGEPLPLREPLGDMLPEGEALALRQCVGVCDTEGEVEGE